MLLLLLLPALGQPLLLPLPLPLLLLPLLLVLVEERQHAVCLQQAEVQRVGHLLQVLQRPTLPCCHVEHHVTCSSSMEQVLSVPT
jgi:hypothetical protein